HSTSAHARCNIHAPDECLVCELPHLFALQPQQADEIGYDPRSQHAAICFCDETLGHHPYRHLVLLLIARRKRRRTLAQCYQTETLKCLRIVGTEIPDLHQASSLGRRISCVWVTTAHSFPLSVLISVCHTIVVRPR